MRRLLPSPRTAHSTIAAPQYPWRHYQASASKWPPAGRQVNKRRHSLEGCAVPAIACKSGCRDRGKCNPGQPGDSRPYRQRWRRAVTALTFSALATATPVLRMLLAALEAPVSHTRVPLPSPAERTAGSPLCYPRLSQPCWPDVGRLAKTLAWRARVCVHLCGMCLAARDRWPLVRQSLPGASLQAVGYERCRHRWR
jgi:hypothetical protein